MQRETARFWLFDVKTLRAGGPDYRQCALDGQCGAVSLRAGRVNGAYASHARSLDARLHPGGGDPIAARLRALGEVSGLCVGAYAEASADVHGLVDIVADALAERRWARFGARDVGEARSAFVTILRRRVGVMVAREMARHRLARLHWVGVPRAAIEARAARLRRGVEDRAPAIDAADFFAHQAYALAA